MTSRGTRRRLLGPAIAAAAVLALALLADVVLPPAAANQPNTLYVDRRIGSDSWSGRSPEEPLASFLEATRRARPGTQILVTGYSTSLVYAGTEHRCSTLRGTKDEPITIRRNVYTNTLYPAILTANRKVPGPWRVVERNGKSRTWAADWPHEIQLHGDPDNGFVQLGAIAVYGYADEPHPAVARAAWWDDGKVFIRDNHYDPNEFDIFVKAGDGICLSGDSAHVRIDDLMVEGAVHAVRVEPGAVDIQTSHLVRANVLDDDRIPRSARSGAAR